MKGGARPSSGRPGDTPEPRGFSVAVDRDAGQLTLCASATGAGGGAYLTPVPGVELVFDRSAGWLSGLTVAVSQPGSAVPDEAVAWIAGVFGAASAAMVRDAPRRRPRCVALPDRPGTLGVLSRLARLEAARVTSPVPASRLWAAEAAGLARRAGLPLPRWVLSAAAAPAAGPGGRGPGSRGPAVPAKVMRLLAAGRPGSCPGAPPDAGDSGGQLEASLDLGVAPYGIFRPALWPGADLVAGIHQDGAPLVAAEAALLPGVGPADLADCRVRLVDADCRRTLATAALQVGDSSRARAELPAPSGLRALARSGAVWAEVVDDERRPVDGTRLRRIRRALRWADAALRAQSKPNGLAPELTDEQWIRLAALAWDRCRADWAASGDPNRAGLAALGPATGRSRPFLAELVRDPAVLP